jgi:hypothetical protein
MGTRERALSTEGGIKGLGRNDSSEISNVHFLSPGLKATSYTPNKMNPLNYRFKAEEATHNTLRKDSDHDTTSVNSYNNPYLVMTNPYLNNQRGNDVNKQLDNNIYQQNYVAQKYSPNQNPTTTGQSQVNSSTISNSNLNNKFTSQGQFSSTVGVGYGATKNSVLGSQNSLVSGSVNDQTAGKIFAH